MKWPKGAIRNLEELRSANDFVFGTYPPVGSAPLEIRKIYKNVLLPSRGRGWFPNVKSGNALFNNYWDAYAFLQRYLHDKRNP